MALQNALMKMNVLYDISPEGLVSFLTADEPIQENIISFTDNDLPFEEKKHKDLHLTVACMSMNVPMPLVDNGSAIDVCPLQTAHRLGLKDEDSVLLTKASELTTSAQSSEL